MSALQEQLQAVWELLRAGGATVGEGIFWAARLLREPDAPGFASLVILVFFVGALGWYWPIKARRIRTTIVEARRVVGDGRAAFDEARFDEIAKSFREWEENADRNLRRRLLWTRRRLRPTPRHSVAEAWREFAETMNRQRGIFNTVRPREFFDRELLHMEHRFFAQLPALFVSSGLLLTFLGLVAALDQTRAILQASGSDNIGEGLRTLLQVAGAKFIMSLTGLFCSILFGVVFRSREGKIDEELHGLCADIERGLEYRSADSFLLEKILDVLEEQKAQLQTFSTELVAQVARPLREEIPQAISRSIQDAMTPSLERFDRNAGQGLDRMIDTVATSMSGSVQDSAQAVNEMMQKVAGELDAVASRLDRSAAEMGGQVGEAVAALSGEISTLRRAMAASSREATNTLSEGARDLLSNLDETLQAIRGSTATGAEDIDQAVVAMTKAVSELTSHAADTTRTAARENSRLIEVTSRNAVDGIDRALAAMTQVMGELTSNAAEASETAVRENSRLIEATSRHASEVLDRSAAAVSREMERMAAAIATQVREAASALQAGLLERLESLPASVRELNAQIVAGTEAMQGAARVVQASSDRIEDAHDAVRGSSRALREAAGPIGSSIQRLENSNRLMEAKVTATANALESEAREMTRITIQNLHSVAETIRNAQAGSQEVRRALEQTVRRFEGLVRQFTGLDQRLGEAWSQLGTNVATSLEEFRRFEEQLNREFAASLRKLREVIEQVEPFTPARGRKGRRY